MSYKISRFAPMVAIHHSQWHKTANYIYQNEDRLRTGDLLVSQSVIPSRRSLGGFSPDVFTQEGVAMLSSVLRSLPGHRREHRGHATPSSNSSRSWVRTRTLLRRLRRLNASTAKTMRRSNFQDDKKASGTSRRFQTPHRFSDGRKINVEIVRCHPYGGFTQLAALEVDRSHILAMLPVSLTSYKTSSLNERICLADRHATRK